MSDSPSPPCSGCRSRRTPHQRGRPPTPSRPALAYGTGLDGERTGAIVVDPRGAVPNDGLVVLGMWTDTVAGSFVPRHRVPGVVDGRSWPNSERLTATAGHSVRCRAD
ncbi:MAG TPA: hypothetical protein PLX31_04995 [Gemmatimonadaceae bacterium]|nr:hypothetical protein [Gemmatimonadaceae bacterium]HPV74223.1 hypothetical protein [Gemmatimonadaceae bacterium]